MRGLVYFLLLLATGSLASTLSYTYDPAGRLVNLNYGGTTNLTLSYDNNGNLLNQSTFVSGNPDLSISQLATPATVVAGLVLHYSVGLFNNSSVSATSVVVTNVLPANAVLISATVSQGSVTDVGPALDWNLGSLAGGSNAYLTFSLRATSVGLLTNFASVASAQTDPDPANNTTTLVTPVVGPPALAAGMFGSSFIASWPVTFGGSFSIQHADSLVPPVSWVSDTIPPALSGDQFYVAEPATNSTRFYRLASGP